MVDYEKVYWIYYDVCDGMCACGGFRRLYIRVPYIFCHPSARLLAFMDRAFYSGGMAFAFKPAAAVLSARRAGTTASFDVINKYFTICSMPVVSSTYWNHVYGSQPDEVERDAEGLMVCIAALVLTLLAVGGYQLYRYPGTFRGLSDKSLGDAQVEELRDKIMAKDDKKCLVARTPRAHKHLP